MRVPCIGLCLLLAAIVPEPVAAGVEICDLDLPSCTPSDCCDGTYKVNLGLVGFADETAVVHWKVWRCVQPSCAVLPTIQPWAQGCVEQAVSTLDTCAGTPVAVVVPIPSMPCDCDYCLSPTPPADKGGDHIISFEVWTDCTTFPGESCDDEDLADRECVDQDDLHCTNRDNELSGCCCS